MFENAYQFIDWYMPSSYAGITRNFDAGGYDKFYESDKAQYKNGLFAECAVDLAATITRLQTMKHEAETYFRTTGAVTGTVPQIGSYEGCMHVQYLGGIPNLNSMLTVLKEAKQDPRWATMQTNLYTELRNKIGGHHVMFVDYEDFAVGYGSIAQTFGCLSQSAGLRVNEQHWSALTTFAQAYG